MPRIHPRDRILFQGDSITDCGRRNEDGKFPLGHGYVAMLAGLFAARRPDLEVEILNRGIGGDRTAELLARWQPDCLDLKPQVLSLKIGVNDVWRKNGEWNGQKHIALPEYRDHVRRLCDTAREAGVREVVLISPTTIEADNHGPLNTLLGDYVAWGREYAQTTGALWVDARTPLLHARSLQPDIPWTPDGCHPSTAGHALIAAAWFETVLSA
jgi:lysophospholipase L1-like esterase